MAHIHEKIDFTASVYVVFDNKVLLHKHAKTGRWLPPGGHIELDEDPNQAALREVKEEAGIEVELAGAAQSFDGSTQRERNLVPPRFMNRHYYDGKGGHEHVDLLFFGRSKTSDILPEAENGMRWVTKGEIERDEIETLPHITYVRARLAGRTCHMI